MAPDVRARLELEPEGLSARRARRLVEHVCRAAGMDGGVLETAALLTSEIVSNAVRHAGGTSLLQVVATASVLRVEVQDGQASLPVVPGEVDAGAEGGRGVLLVDALADRWGADRLGPGGKSVWFELVAGSAEAARTP